MLVSSDYCYVTSLKVISPIVIDVNVAFLSRSCIVLKQQKISSRFLLQTTPCLFQIVLKFDLRGQPVPPQILPQIDPR